MSHFTRERFLVVDGDDLRLALHHDRHAIHPVHPMRIELQLVGARGVVEHRHLAVADHDELLLLVGMEPAHEHVGAHAARERERAHRDVRHRLLEIRPATTRGIRRHLVEQPEDHVHVVRREAPQRVLLGADAAEVQAVRIDVAQPSELPARDELPKPLDRRVVFEKMTRHQHPPAPIRLLGERAPFRDERLLDEHVLVRLQRAPGEIGVLRGRRGDDDGVQLGIRKHRGGIVDAREGMLAPCRLSGGAVGVTDDPQRAARREIAREVAPPLPVSDQADRRGRLAGYKHQYATPCASTAARSSMPRTSMRTPPRSARSRSTKSLTARLRNSSWGTATTTAS